MADQVVPGPCPPTGCPAPTFIDCVQVTKVYDFCFQTLDVNHQVFEIPSSCLPLPSGATATGVVSSVTCTAQTITPILTSSGTPTGFANVTLFVTATITFTITNSSGATVCTFSGFVTNFTTVVLCAPTGVTVTCQAPSSSVGPCVIMGDDLICPVLICLLIESVATVNLLVPTYGFCTPAPCVVSPTPPFSCPPSQLFPAQCVTPLPTTTPEVEYPVEGPVV